MKALTPIVGVVAFVILIWLMPTYGSILLGGVYAAAAVMAWFFGSRSIDRWHYALYGLAWGAGVAAFGAISIPLLPYLKAVQAWLHSLA